jgi:nucleoside-diphosphate-sugar epimerase
MDVLLIGGTRFLGPLLVLRLLAGGHRVTILNRGTMPDPFGAFSPRLERLVADRRSPELARVLHGRTFDAVIDFAAYERTDALGAVEALRGRTGHYFFIGTGQVYLVREGCPRPATEGDYAGPLLPRPDGPPDLDQWSYGMGKRDCEDALVQAWEKERFPATRLRIPVVNGERDDRRRIEGYLFRMLDGGPLIVPDGGAQQTRHVYGGEVVRAIVSMLGRSETLGGAYNLCQEETPTVRDLLATVAEIVGASPRFVTMSSDELLAAGLPPAQISPYSTRWTSFMDPGKARAQLGFQHVPLADYLARIVAAFLARPPAEPPPSYLHREKELQLVG